MRVRHLLASLGVCGVTLAGVAAPVTGAAVTTGVHPMVTGVSHLYMGTRPPTTAQCRKAIGIPCYGAHQLQTAYNMLPAYDAGLTGRGRTIALVDSFGSPTIRSDLRTFDRAYGLPAPPRFDIIQPAGPVPPYDPNNGTMVGWAEETTLDVQWSHAMAPGANILLVETPVAETEGLGGIPQIVKAENYVINHHLADVISQSFGATEQTFPTAQSLLRQRSAFMNAYRSNVSVLASTGDSGATGARRNGVTLYTRRVIGWPASDPLVTAVGGTQLHLNARGLRTAPDNAWSGSGGGVSSIFARPAYQNSVAGVVGSHRGIPDFSMSADPDGGALVYFSFGGIPSGWYVIGGTSESSPLFSGIVAIADQAAGHDLGLVNPALYRLGTASPGIVDITSGNNTATFTQNGHTYTVKGYQATRGYDLVTGLGTANGARLIAELAR